MIKIIKSAIGISLAFIIMVLIGCATPANYQSMTVKPVAEVEKNSKLANAIVVSGVSGGKKTNPLWTSQVENEGFKKALEESLNLYGYLAASPDKAKYKLDVNLLKFDQPTMSFNPEAKSTVVYKLTGTNISKEYKIEAIGGAKVSDAFFSDERFRMANERSAQENIKEFLRELNRI